MNAKAYLLLAITTFIWGGNSVAGKIAVGHVSPMLLTGIRWTIACALLAILTSRQVRADWPEIRRHWKLLFFYGAVGFTAFNVALYSALQYTTAINVVIEQAGIPMVIFAMNFMLFRMRVSAAQWIGFVVTLFGVVLTATHGDPRRLLALDLNQGDVLMLFAVLVYAAYTVSLRTKPAIHWKSLIAASAFAALVSTLPLVIWEAATDRLIWPDELGWGIGIFAGVFPSLVSQVLYVWGVEMIGPNRAGLFINLIPVFGTLLSILLIGEALEVFHVVALALALGGIAIAEKGRPREAA
ncbi:DMT family transporter [Rhizobium sp. YIM 134829]|uniref:DMT family transporter n=1 Tax=Rhizobium sp. YIM 134829 TaxID=3390453 RepID=UPI00397BBC82